jgi:succinoglycan biosynthesis protein ExoA
LTSIPYKLVSILIPIRNEAKYIRSCLEHIYAQQDLTVSVEIIVADGMSSDCSREIIKEMQDDHPNLFLIDNPGKIVSTGLNLALKIAKGDIIIRIDGHCLIDPDYISKCVKHLTEQEIDGVGGPMTTIGETSLSETIAIAMSSKFGVGNSAFRTLTGKSMLVDTVPFPAYTHQIINRIGLFDEELIRNQDDEYNYRI